MPTKVAKKIRLEGKSFCVCLPRWPILSECINWIHFRLAQFGVILFRHHRTPVQKKKDKTEHLAMPAPRTQRRVPDPFEKFRQAVLKPAPLERPPTPMPKRTMKMARHPLNVRSRLPLLSVTTTKVAEESIKTKGSSRTSAYWDSTPFWPSEKERMWMTRRPFKVLVPQHIEQGKDAAMTLRSFWFDRARFDSHHVHSVVPFVTTEMPPRPKRRASVQSGGATKIRRLPPWEERLFWEGRNVVDSTGAIHFKFLDLPKDEAKIEVKEVRKVCRKLFA